MKKIVVSGATGFIGSAVIEELRHRSGVEVLGLCRHLPVELTDTSLLVAVGDLADAQLLSVLQGAETVIHTAARVHVMHEASDGVLGAYQHANIEGSLSLARQAAAAGVRRFVFLSTAKVNGENTSGRSPFSPDQAAAPEGAYSVSKHEAELALKALCAQLGMEWVIIRPPLVYGPGVKANFASLLRLCSKRIPLPFASINNRRSMVYLGNLVDFILHCATHPVAANQVFLISDRHDLSLAELVGGIRLAMGRKPGLLPIPPILFRLVGRIIGRQSTVERLIGDLQVDTSKAHELLGWHPLFTVQQGLSATVAGFSTNIGPDVRLLRTLDVFLALLGLVLGFPVLVTIYVLCLFDTGSPLFLQERVGRNKKPFTLVKFRTMKMGTASVASHLASSSSITRLGGILRKTKLDELPQLWNVFRGEMSLVGPRPNLFNQKELIAERDALRVYAVRPGITGLAQIRGVDMSNPQLLAQTDAHMIRQQSLRNYIGLILQTLIGKGAGDRVRD